LRKKEGGTRHAQYRANAELLCARKEFANAHFSAGDEYIWNVGSHKELGLGTPEKWLRAGINHHMTLTARQVLGLVAMAG
jgi:Beta protein